MNLKQFSLINVLLLLASPSFSLAQETVAVKTPEQVLSDMSVALRQLNYSGTFSLEQGGMLETLEVIHTVSEDQSESDTLSHLNGPERIFKRDRSRDCLSIAETIVQIHADSEPLISEHYQLQIKGKQRVAGRLAEVLQVLPRDRLRYGYTIYVDQKSSLPLLIMTINYRGKVLERIQFSHLVTDADEGLLEADLSKKFSQSALSKELCQAPSYAIDWEIAWLPQGFKVFAYHQHANKGESLSFTDGLATFSVFVQKQSPELNYQGVAQKGGSVVAMHKTDMAGEEFMVSVVGEIPVLSAERIASAVTQRKLLPN